MERPQTLDAYLAGARHSAGLGVEEVCRRTKIQARFVEALEAGRWGKLPSNTHVRAFSVALAKACGADGALAAELALRALAAAAPAPGAAGMERGFDLPAPPPVLGRELPPFAAEPARPAYAGPAVRDSPMAAASARLRAMPLGLLLGLLGAAGALSYGAAWSVDHWRRHEAAVILASAQSAAVPAPPPAASSAPIPGPSAVGPAPNLGGPVGQLAPEALQAYAAKSSPAAAAVAPGLELVLRARRPCWLVLRIDGKRLPTVTMADGDKLRWPVSRRAVLLAGNVGALRVWWQGDNLGYLGPLDERVNALVFEPGRAPRVDPSAALPLPPGIE